MLAAILATFAAGLLLGWLLGHEAGLSDKAQDAADRLAWQAYWATESGTVTITHGTVGAGPSFPLNAPEGAVGLAGVQVSPTPPGKGWHQRPLPTRAAPLATLTAGYIGSADK